MATQVVMPQMGESIAEGTITKWLVKVGEKVERDQPLFEISTDKVDAEIPSPSSGVLLEIRHGAGETVAVNAVVGVIGEAGESTASAKPPQVEIDGVKVVVDPDVCQGHARCWEICPQVFSLDEAGHAAVASPDVPPGLECDVEEAAANCPERAIALS